MSQHLSKETREAIRNHEIVKNEMVQTVTVDTCFDHMSKAEIIEGVNCSYCNHVCNSTCTYSVAVAPKIMIAQVKRFKYGQPKNCTGIKIQHDISVNTMNGPVRYKLKTLVNHVGADAHFGHYYITTFSHDLQSWVNINDGCVGLCDENTISTTDIYLMIYEKVLVM